MPQYISSPALSPSSRLLITYIHYLTVVQTLSSLSGTIPEGFSLASVLPQWILHSAARVIFLKHAVPPLLQALQWFLLLAVRIESKLLLAPKALYDLAFPTSIPFTPSLPFPRTSQTGFLSCTMNTRNSFRAFVLRTFPQQGSLSGWPLCHLALSVNVTSELAFPASSAKVAHTTSLSITLPYFISFIAPISI